MRSFSSGEHPPVEASRMLGWTEYDQKRARASGGMLVGVVVLVVIFFSCYLLNAFMKLVCVVFLLLVTAQAVI